MAELLLLSSFFGVRGHEYLKHRWSTAFTNDSCLCPPGPADEADICQGGSRLLVQALSYSGRRGPSHLVGVSAGVCLLGMEVLPSLSVKLEGEKCNGFDIKTT